MENARRAGRITQNHLLRDHVAPGKFLGLGRRDHFLRRMSLIARRTRPHSPSRRYAARQRASLAR